MGRKSKPPARAASLAGLRPSLMTVEELAPLFASKIAGLTPLFDQEERWPAARLRMRTYVGDIAWPAELATSARAVVFRRGRVVVVRQTDGQRHINPGGRIEPGETVEAAARREVLEETGWRLGPLTPLGFHHFQPLGEPPAGFAYRWGDFVQPLFLADGVSYHPALRDRTQQETGARLTSVRRALGEVGPRDAAVLRAALALRRTL